MKDTLVLTIPLKPRTVERLSKRPLGEKETTKRVRKAFELVYGKTPEEALADVIDNTVWEATFTEHQK